MKRHKKRASYDSRQLDKIYKALALLTKQLALEAERRILEAEKSKCFENEIDRISKHLYEIELMLGCKPTQRQLRKPKA